VPAFDAPAEILAQLTWWWDNLFRPRLDGLSEDEFTWAPAPGAVSEVGFGDYGEAGPLTTIKWRLQHIAADVFEMRLATLFREPRRTRAEFKATLVYPESAAASVAWLEAVYGEWVRAVENLDAAGWERAPGSEEPRYGDQAFGALVLHIHREAIHHGAEILTLRDLYAAQ
jgi:hypothetical protein